MNLVIHRAFLCPYLPILTKKGLLVTGIISEKELNPLLLKLNAVLNYRGLDSFPTPLSIYDTFF